MRMPDNDVNVPEYQKTSKERFLFNYANLDELQIIRSSRIQKLKLANKSLNF